MSAAVEPRLLLTPTPKSGAPYPLDRDLEFDFLSACCSTRWDASAKQRIKDIAPHLLNWGGLLDLAEHHGLIPALIEQSDVFGEWISQQDLARLRARYRQSASRSLWFTEELGRILDVLKSAGIVALAHKGLALAAILYSDVTARQFRDLDLLIQPTDVANAKAALADLGYQCGVHLSDTEQRSYLKSGYEYVFHSSAGRNLIEIQWRILPRFYAIDFDLRGMFARASEVNVDGRTWPILSAENLLLVLCVHAAKHVWVQLSWLRDITQLWKSRELDWQFVQREAERLGIRRIVELNFDLADRLLGPGCPPGFVRINAGQTTDLCGEILQIVRSSAPFDSESVAYFRLILQIRERWQDRARMIWRLASTPSLEEWKTVQLPGELFPLYHIVRAFRLVKRLAFS